MHGLWGGHFPRARPRAMFSAKVNCIQTARFFLYILLQVIGLLSEEIQLEGKGGVRNRAGDDKELVCPPPNLRPASVEALLLNLLPCTRNDDCPLHDDLRLLCCKTANEKDNRCRHGVTPPKPKPTHMSLLGVQRYCPENEPLAEFLPVMKCSNDSSCWPRICCSGYCRTPALPKSVSQSDGNNQFTSLRSAAEYLQCTAPPAFDFFRRPCHNLRDCFPQICCQERDMKVCRPAKKSILPLIAAFIRDAGEG